MFISSKWVYTLPDEYDQVAAGFGGSSYSEREQNVEGDEEEEEEEVHEGEKSREESNFLENIDWTSQEGAFEHKEQLHPVSSAGPAESTRRTFMDSSEYYKAFI